MADESDVSSEGDESDISSEGDEPSCVFCQGSSSAAAPSLCGPLVPLPREPRATKRLWIHLRCGLWAANASVFLDEQQKSRLHIHRRSGTRVSSHDT